MHLNLYICKNIQLSARRQYWAQVRGLRSSEASSLPTRPPLSAALAPIYLSKDPKPAPVSSARHPEQAQRQAGQRCERAHLHDPSSLQSEGEELFAGAVVKSGPLVGDMRLRLRQG